MDNDKDKKEKQDAGNTKNKINPFKEKEVADTEETTTEIAADEQKLKEAMTERD
jgi:hypothetical protein